jgi:hypothetical protein
LKEQLLMQIRSQALRVGRVAGLIPERSDLERMIDPLLEEARTMVRLKDPRGLYSYCWCRDPSAR